MTDQQAEVPWREPTAEERAADERSEAASSDRYYHVPARDAAERAEYDRQEATEAADAEAEERYIHFNGHHVQDPPAHGDWCTDSCPYDTPEQARERAEREACVQAREDEYAAEMAMEAGQ
jgi:hypothetical protein